MLNNFLKLNKVELHIVYNRLVYKGIGSDSLNESINIENPSTDEYNDIIVNGEKVGYIILSPARSLMVNVILWMSLI